jgi:hypothetical protein
MFCGNLVCMYIFSRIGKLYQKIWQPLVALAWRANRNSGHTELEQNRFHAKVTYVGHLTINLNAATT